MENRKKLNKAEQSGKAMSSFMIAGFAALSGMFLMIHHDRRLIPFVVGTGVLYFLISTVLVVRAVRAIKNVK